MNFIKEAEKLKKELKTRTVCPAAIVRIKKEESSFQGLCTEHVNDFSEKIRISSGDEIILDFGEHTVGYLSFSLVCPDGNISDSPVRLGFYFGEFPLEIEKENYEGLLGSGWLQREERTAIFTPASITLERRYSFRFLKIKRLDSAAFPIEINDIFVKSVSAVDIKDAPVLSTGDTLLDKIYEMSLLTLRDCEQDVFEDGPKRDRRLWIGDLRLQALVDYKTFKNIDLVKRCIYLFAGYLNSNGEVVPCVYPDSPPYRLEWTFADYSLFLISCIYDYYVATEDKSLLREIYDIAKDQADIVSERLDRDFQSVAEGSFIDWCPGLDKSCALLGVFIYTLRQLEEISKILGKKHDSITKEREKRSAQLLILYKNGAFTAPSGQISVHSQIWGVLSGVLTLEESCSLLEGLDTLDTEYTPRTPYMIHYYIEALVSVGLCEKALEVIKNIWGKIAEAGFDTCPEIFNPQNDFESPYNAAEINSACHAWSCTPAYWINILKENDNV